MIISEKQIMQLIEYCRYLAIDNLKSVTSTNAIKFIDEITNQQSEELKVIE